jgi:Uma2 family endonuclease
MAELFVQLDRRSEHLVPLFTVDVDLQLVPPDRPGTVRAPDLVVLNREAFERVRDGTQNIVASDLVLVGEILGPGSRRTDALVKRREYVDAGIRHYWIIDLDDGPSLTAHHLAGESDYASAGPARGVFETDLPFPVRIDLTELAS